MGTKEHQPTHELSGGEGSTADAGSVDDQEAESRVALSLDHTFEILKNHRRREVLKYLRDEESEVTLSDLAEHIAALENDTEVALITSSQRKRVYVGLYQCHLPKMADMGIIEFEQNRGIVRIGPNAPQLFEYIDAGPTDGEPDFDDYLRLSIAGLVLTPATLLLGGVVELLAVAGLFLVLLALCSLSVRDATDLTLPTDALR
jgi:hypothetical protein